MVAKNTKKQLTQIRLYELFRKDKIFISVKYTNQSIGEIGEVHYRNNSSNNILSIKDSKNILIAVFGLVIRLRNFSLFRIMFVNFVSSKILNHNIQLVQLYELLCGELEQPENLLVTISFVDKKCLRQNQKSFMQLFQPIFKIICLCTELLF